MIGENLLTSPGNCEIKKEHLMETMKSIEARRSIRKFKPLPVPQNIVHTVLRAATLAPSGKNKQPWKFYVIQGDKRQEVADVMWKGIQRLEESGINTGSAKFSLKIMEQAPVTIIIFNPSSKNPFLKRDTIEVFSDVVDIQSIGAAIQNMLLAALDFGLGSLWICDIFAAYEELSDWFDEKGEMIAAVSLGYPDQFPNARPRHPVEDVAVFLD